MDEFDDGSERVVMMALIAQGPGTEQQQERTQAFPSAVDEVFGNLSDQRDIRVQVMANDRVQRFQIIGRQEADRFKTHSTFSCTGRHSQSQWVW